MGPIYRNLAHLGGGPNPAPFSLESAIQRRAHAMVPVDDEDSYEAAYDHLLAFASTIAMLIPDGPDGLETTLRELDDIEYRRRHARKAKRKKRRRND